MDLPTLEIEHVIKVDGTRSSGTGLRVLQTKIYVPVAISTPEADQTLATLTLQILQISTNNI